MKLLVLGGTIFLGRHVIDAALAAGHDVTMLTRGRHGTALFPQVERLVGDREDDLSALAGRAFDAVIDCSGYTPEHVTHATQALGASAGHWVFVSTISVNAGFPPGRIYDETAPLAEGHEGYGALKARAEETLLAAAQGRAAIVRPGLIVGPHDPTGRFTYWPRRVARGGDVLAPGRAERPVQFVDARDLAAWCVALAQARTAGTFNAVGPNMSMREFLDTCRAAAASDARWRWVDDAALLALGVAPWTGLPLWLPEHDPAFGGMLLADPARARAAGLRTRDARATIADTLAWTPDADDLAAARPVATLTPEREAEILASLPA